jgi:hypothetical protein
MKSVCMDVQTRQSNDLSRDDIDDKGHVDEDLSSRDSRHVRHPSDRVDQQQGHGLGGFSGASADWALRDRVEAAR